MSGKRVAILQSSYIPWKGYFDLIRGVDEFVLYDEAQYTRRDWRNRNRIKTASGLQWLTIPVRAAGNYTAPISAIEIGDPAWAERHWRTIAHNYARAPYYRLLAPRLEPLFVESRESRLSAVNCRLLAGIAAILEIQTKLSWSSDFALPEGRTERLVAICRQAGAASYLTGPSAAAYLDEALFRDAGIDVTYADYSGYPEYPQLFGRFEHQVSILDLLFNTGGDAGRYLLDF